MHPLESIIMSKIKSTYWTTGRFAPDYVPTPEEFEVGLARTLRIYARGLRTHAGAAMRFGDEENNGIASTENTRRCSRVQECGHPCYDFLWQNGGGGCSPCRVPILATRDDCGHQTTILCNMVVPISKCNANCTRLLKCGHPCTNLCGSPCVIECRHRDCWQMRREKDIESRNSNVAKSETDFYDDEGW